VKRYVPRLVDAEVETRLRAAGAVLLEGPRACGKTESGRHHARSEVRLDTDRNARETAALDAGLVLDGSTPRLLDEWQVVPDLWNAVRRRVDDVGAPGLFILTAVMAAYPYLRSGPFDMSTRLRAALPVLGLLRQGQVVLDRVETTTEGSS
jgi:predicted AAA+ superfamily ATPase